MTSTALRLRRTCWIALLAMLSLTLAPTLSHALASTRSAPAWLDVCTPQGAQRVVLDDLAAGEELPRSAATHLEHCDYCSLATHATPLPYAASALRLPAQAGAGAPALRTRVPSSRLAWHSAQPRAPPAPF